MTRRTNGKNSVSSATDRYREADLTVRMRLNSLRRIYTIALYDYYPIALYHFYLNCVEIGPGPARLAVPIARATASGWEM